MIQVPPASRSGWWRSLSVRIAIGCAIAGLLLIASSVVTHLQVRRLGETTRQLDERNLPLVSASHELQISVVETLAALRGWLLHGQTRYQEEREQLWRDQIEQSWQQISQLSASQENPEFADRLLELRSKLDNFRETQDQIERLASSPENHPALVILTQDAAPRVKIMIHRIAKIVDVERTNEASPSRKVLLADLADFRGTFYISIAALRGYLLTGDESFLDEFHEYWQQNSAHMQTIDRRRWDLTETQAENFIEVQRLRSQLHTLVAEMIAMRSGPNWNRARSLLAGSALPIADDLDQHLVELVKHEQQLMDQQQRRTAHYVSLLNTVQQSTLGFGLAGLLLFGILISRTAVSPLRRAARMANAIANGDLNAREQLSDSSEAEELGHALEHMAQSLQEHLEALEESKKRLGLAIEASPSGMLMINRDGEIVIANSQISEMFGYPLNELKGQAVEMLVPDPDRQRHETERLQYTANPVRRVMGSRREVMGLHRSGRLIPVEVALSPMHHNGETFILASLFDVSERKQAEIRLHKLNETLARQNEELEQFSYMASHDLQEPLRNLASYAVLLKEDLGEDLEGDVADDLHYILDASHRMQQLISALLTYSRNGKEALQCRPIKLDACVDAALESLETQIVEAEAQIERQPLPKVIADQTMITQLYQNLISNAIKFNDEGAPRVELTVEYRKHEVVLGVRDNGIGIDPEYAEKAFLPFKRLNGMSKFPGSGIGLSICQNTIQRHRGSIWVESKLGQGAHFRFTLPLARSRSSIYGASADQLDNASHPAEPAGADISEFVVM